MNTITNSYKTYFDKSQIVDSENWAVTLVAATGIDRFHAQILVETVDNSGEYKKFIVHLVGGGTQPVRWEITNRTQGSLCSTSGFAKIGLVKISQPYGYEKTINSSGHSPTWMRSAEKIQAMLDQVREESDQPLQKPRSFKILGNKSFLAPPIKVYTVKKSLGGAYLAQPALMRKVFDLCEMHKSSIKEGHFNDDVHELCAQDIRWTFRCLGRSPNIISMIIDNLTDMFTPSAIEESSNTYRKLRDTTFKVIHRVPSLSPKEEVQGYCKLTEGRKWENMSQRDRAQVVCAQNDMIVALYSKIHKKFSIKNQTPDNCCTWALEKLAIVDVHHESTSKGMFLTNTRDYLM